jgi:hypothetical protein
MPRGEHIDAVTYRKLTEAIRLLGMSMSWECLDKIVEAIYDETVRASKEIEKE